jgi:hypothetical protein
MTNIIPVWLQILSNLVALITGSVGCYYGVRAYFRESRNRVLEQRLRLRMDLTRTEFKCSQLHPVITNGLQSRVAILSAKGLGQSGNELQFKQWVDADTERAAELSQQLTAIANNSDPDDIDALVARIAEVHGVEVEVQSIADKYKRYTEEDAADRRQIADHRLPRL